jgi:hypothetical protein
MDPKDNRYGEWLRNNWTAEWDRARRCADLHQAVFFRDFPPTTDEPTRTEIQELLKRMPAATPSVTQMDDAS